MNSPTAEGLPHFLIGNGNCGQTRVMEVLPLEWDSDMCGNGSKGTYDNGAYRSIQIAICKDRQKNYDYFRNSMIAAVDLCVELCEKYRLSNTDIVSHKEAYNRFMASKAIHPDLWLSLFGYNMDDFRKWVRYRVETDEEFLPVSKKREKIRLRYVVALKKDENGKYIKVKGKYKFAENAIAYCPYGNKVFDIEEDKMIYSLSWEAGAKVTVIKPVIYGIPRSFKVEYDEYEIIEVDGNRIIIGKDGRTIAAVDKKNLKIVR